MLRAPPCSSPRICRPTSPAASSWQTEGFGPCDARGPTASKRRVPFGLAGTRPSPDTAGMKFATPLPVDAVLGELRAALVQRTSAVLVAPPGAGKTTRVPLALMNEGWLQGRKILVLEPLRIAARAAAARMAHSLSEAVG